MEFRDTWKKCAHLEGFSPWFEVFDVGGGVYAIYEPYHFQEVISYLITGTQKAVLWDTGMGIYDIKSVVEELTDKPVTVINSHVHFDHVGDNHKFENIFVYNEESALERLRRGYGADELRPHTDRKLFDTEHFDMGSSHMEHSDIELFDIKNMPPDFEYVIAPCQPSVIEDGEIIDLGGKKLKVIHTPGHAPECIMLYDEESGELFTGDSYYPGWMYAHFSGDFYRDSVIADYANSLEKAAKLPELKILHPSHNEPIMKPDELKKAAKAMRALADGKDINGAPMTKEERYLASLPDEETDAAGYVIQDDLYMFDFDGVRIVARKRVK